MWLWLFLVIAARFVSDVIYVLGDLTTLMTLATGLSLIILLRGLLGPLWVMFWWEWFGLRERRWIPRTAWALAAAGIGARFFANSPSLGLSFVPHPALHWFNLLWVWCGAAVALLLVGILVEGFRRDRVEALLAAVPVLLYLFPNFSNYLLTTFDIPIRIFPFGLGIDASNIAYILMIMTIGALALRRFVRTQVRQEVKRKAIAQELEQAQQLQQRVLVPETVVSPYFTVEAEYRPAQTVGRDFFQTLTKPDGGLLVVIGDVSGKGVSAAMLVAVLVGAIRNQAEYSFDPVALLLTLNRRMIGLGRAFRDVPCGGVECGWRDADGECGSSAAVSERGGNGAGGIAAAGYGRGVGNIGADVHTEASRPVDIYDGRRGGSDEWSEGAIRVRAGARNQRRTCRHDCRTGAGFWTGRRYQRWWE
jgi:hypothetical protein